MHLPFAIEELEPLATGRTESLFAADLARWQGELRERIAGRRVAVIGAAGSIGSAVVRAFLPFEPRAMVLLDLDENGLVELVRDLRSTAGLRLPPELAELPIGLGSEELYRFFRDAEPFDYLLNLCAMKHVRSEKDVYCLARMVDTNVLFLDELLERLPSPFGKLFSVSSDKAVHPASLMGATKILMELTLLLRSQRQPYSTARFANVAFSNGSLPYGFLHRLRKRQPLAAPRDVRRFFISHREAGELCLLACVLGDNGEVFFPRPELLREDTFSAIAVRLLEKLGYEPYECASDEEARRRVEELAAQRRWPCSFSDSDTSGEKAYEEFFSESEMLDFERFQAIGTVRRTAAALDADAVTEFLAFARAARTGDGLTKTDYVAALGRALPTLRHIETGKSLDDKM